MPYNWVNELKKLLIGATHFWFAKTLIKIKYHFINDTAGEV